MYCNAIISLLILDLVGLENFVVNAASASVEFASCARPTTLSTWPDSFDRFRKCRRLEYIEVYRGLDLGEKSSSPNRIHAFHVAKPIQPLEEL